ncbi:hypothetical protein KIN20_003035 [Parelaphostrongylus tenuis]|uniref:Uncharacterized protein n=1 Tax=Parelaphostrongylus tenuis TaxID=148309 RepID=A0AAD5LYK7_PARTN|nr:hypothetical protein KIN20_003035 [Parelaphostrongylus tenuis]
MAIERFCMGRIALMKEAIRPKCTDVNRAETDVWQYDGLSKRSQLKSVNLFLVFWATYMALHCLEAE